MDSFRINPRAMDDIDIHKDAHGQWMEAGDVRKLIAEIRSTTCVECKGDITVILEREGL